MLTGEPPFAGGGLMATMYAHVHQPPEPVEKLRPDCPEGLRNAVMRMLAKEAGDRWPSIEDIIAVIGSPSLTPDDPSRSQLIAIAKTGQRGGLAVTTPKSPIPLLRTPSPLLRASAAGAGASAAQAPPPSDATTGVAIPPRRTSAFSLALALGGVLVGVGSIGVALKIRSPAHPGGAETGAAAPLAATPPAATPPAPPPAPVVPGNTRSAAPGPAGAASTQPIAKPSQPNVGAAQGTSAPTVPAGPPAHEQEAVEAAIRTYASALDLGSVEQARRAFPAMPESQQTSLEGFFAAGGRITTLWRVTDVRVDGDRATARIRGASRTEPADSAPAIRAVNLRAVLERTPDGWQLRTLGGSGTH
jgi:hypothetical protein